MKSINNAGRRKKSSTPCNNIIGRTRRHTHTKKTRSAYNILINWAEQRYTVNMFAEWLIHFIRQAEMNEETMKNDNSEQPWSIAKNQKYDVLLLLIFLNTIFSFVRFYSFVRCFSIHISVYVCVCVCRCAECVSHSIIDENLLVFPVFFFTKMKRKRNGSNIVINRPRVVREMEVE